MALFNYAKRIPGSRSNTKLIISGHASPAEDWLLDPQFNSTKLSSVYNNGKLFDYLYGGPGDQEVTIPKGRAVAAGPLVKNVSTGKMQSTITLPGLTANGNCIGVTPQNITKDWLQSGDRFGGNKPEIITQDYITLPYVQQVSPSTMDATGLLTEETEMFATLKNPWGAVIGANVSNGDYLKATASGRLTLWDKAKDNARDVVAQVLAMDFNQTPTGWLQWMLWDINVRKQDDMYINRTNENPSGGDDGGYKYDPNYVKGYTQFQSLQSPYLTNPTGIPGLTDGSGDYPGLGINDTVLQDINLGTIPTGIVDNTTITIQLLDPAGGSATNVRSLEDFKIGGTQVNANSLAVQWLAGTITYKAMAADAGKTITASYKLLHFGIQSYLDFKGVSGAINLLLLK